MNVLALGGCGGMGKFAVHTALTYDFIERIVIADMDGERAAAFAKECGANASSARIDVDDGGANGAVDLPDAADDGAANGDVDLPDAAPDGAANGDDNPSVPDAVPDDVVVPLP